MLPCSRSTGRYGHQPGFMLIWSIVVDVCICKFVVKKKEASMYDYVGHHQEHIVDCGSALKRR
jgi:hypothetical protein